MASSGKKGRKVKGRTLGLNEFLADENETPQAGYAVATTTKKTDWAAEMENEAMDDKFTLDMFSTGAPKDKFILPTMPRAAREPNIDPSEIPSKPPYTAFLANLPYDIEQEDIYHFFTNLKVRSVRLPRDGGDTGRFKGFGYAEFEDRESLVEALAMNDANLRSRKIRIHVAESQDNERDARGGDRRDGRDDRAGDRTVGDWRSAPREESQPREDRYRNGSSDSSMRPPTDSVSDRFFDSRMDKSSQDRDRRDKDNFGRGFERGNRGHSGERERGPSTDRGYSSGERERDRERSGFGYGGDRYRNSEQDRDRYDPSDRGYDRGGRGSRRDFGSDFQRFPERREDSYGGGRGGRGAPYDRGSSYDREPERGGRDDRGRDERENTPKERPKLVLKPRSVPIDKANQAQAQSSIFGGAKPVDTAAKEREIEERLRLEREGKLGREEVERRERKDSDRREDARSMDENPDDRRIANDHEDGPDRIRPVTSRTSQSRSPRSSTSGPIGGSRSDSERLSTSQSEAEDERYEKNTPGKPPSPRKEDNRAVPAPPPKDNPWHKRSSQDGEKENREYSTVPRTRRSSSMSSNNSDKERSRRSSFDRPPPSARKSDDGINKRRDDNRWDDRSRRPDDARPRPDDARPRPDDARPRPDDARPRPDDARPRPDDARPPRDDSGSRRRGEMRDRGTDKVGGRGGGRGRSRGERVWTRKENAPHNTSKDGKYDDDVLDEPKPPVYASTNKYSLLNEDEDVDKGSGSD